MFMRVWCVLGRSRSRSGVVAAGAELSKPSRGIEDDDDDENEDDYWQGPSPPREVANRDVVTTQ
jgi:hypothetical protein